MKTLSGVFQVLTVRARDDDPCCLWIEGSECPVYRYRRPFPKEVKVGSFIYCLGNGNIMTRQEVYS